MLNKDELKNCYCLCIWPKARPSSNLEFILNEIRNLGEIKEIIQLSIPRECFKYLMYQLYQEDLWIGNSSNRHYGAFIKGEGCFLEGELTYFVFFSSEKDESEHIKVKDYIRATLGEEKQSIHITDTFDDTYKIAQIVTDPNPMDLLISIFPEKHPRVGRMINKITRFVKKKRILKRCKNVIKRFCQLYKI